MKKVYCVISNYNDYPWIDRCLGSLKNSEYPVETIVVDDASTDNGCEKIRKNYPEVELIECETNSGYAVANNIGIRRSMEQGADYIFLLNMDAWIEPDSITVLIETAEKNPSYLILSPMHLNAQGDGLDKVFSYYFDPKRCPGILSDIYLDTLKEVYQIEHVMSAAWLLRKKTIEKVGYLDERYFVYGADDNYADRVNYTGGKIGIVPESKIYHAKDEREDEQLPKRKMYDSQKVRGIVTAMNPNLSVIQKSMYLFRKSGSDIILNLLDRDFRHVLQNLGSLFYGSFMIMKYNRSYK